MNPNRKAKIESLLKREIATCLNQEVRDPRLGFVTVTRCEYNDEQQVVTAFYTVLGTDVQKRLTAQCLHKLRGFVQGRYAKVLKMRYLPQLRFAYDEQEVKRQHMEDLIRQARATDPDPDHSPEVPIDDPDEPQG
jgi:ribosome-binding factor A